MVDTLRDHGCTEVTSRTFIAQCSRLAAALAALYSPNARRIGSTRPVSNGARNFQFIPLLEQAEPSLRRIPSPISVECAVAPGLPRLGLRHPPHRPDETSVPTRGGCNSDAVTVQARGSVERRAHTDPVDMVRRQKLALCHEDARCESVVLYERTRTSRRRGLVTLPVAAARRQVVRQFRATNTAGRQREVEWKERGTRETRLSSWHTEAAWSIAGLRHQPGRPDGDEVHCKPATSVRLLLRCVS